MRNNRKCIVCGQEYYFCPSCLDGREKPAWYAIFHDENCHDIYNAVATVLPEQGKEAAKKILDKCDLSNKKNFHHYILKTVNEIYGENKEETVVKTEEIKKEENKIVTEQKDKVKDVKVEQVASAVVDAAKNNKIKKYKRIRLTEKKDESDTDKPHRSGRRLAWLGFVCHCDCTLF